MNLNIQRRTLINSATALALAPMFRLSPAFAQVLQLKVGTALTQEGGAVVLRMQDQKLLEKAAEELGLAGLQAEYLGFTVLLRMLQGLVAGQLQVGMLGSTPLIRSLATPDPAVPIAIAGGGNFFPLQVPKNSPIKKLDDLRGKTVLTILGSDIHLMFARMLEAHFGVKDPKEVNITVRGINALTELSRPLPGIDAIISMEPISTAAEKAGDLVTLVRNDGVTGAAYDGPEGKGAGHKVATFEKTPFAPEAYYPHRVWWVVRQDFLKTNPKAVQAFLMANARAVEALSTMPAAQVVAAYGKEFPGTPDGQAEHIAHVLWRRRTWPWITEGDIRTLPVLSQTKALFLAPIDAANVRQVVALGAEVSKAAWLATGSKPQRAAFDAKQPDDPRGRPVWEIDAWKA